MIKVEKDRKKIIEFLDLVDNENYQMRKFNKPVLVYKIEGNNLKYTIWEQNFLERFGIDNIVGWDYEEDVIYAPDWCLDDDYLDDDNEDDDDE